MKTKKFIYICIMLCVDAFAIGLITGMILSSNNTIDDTVYINKDSITSYEITDDGISLYTSNNRVHFDIKCDKYKGR